MRSATHPPTISARPSTGPCASAAGGPHRAARFMLPAIARAALKGGAHRRTFFTFVLRFPSFTPGGSLAQPSVSLKWLRRCLRIAST